MPFSSNFILIAVIIIGASYFICSFLKNNLLPYFLTRESFFESEEEVIYFLLEIFANNSRAIFVKNSNMLSHHSEYR